MTFAQIETMRDYTLREPHYAPFYATYHECGEDIYEHGRPEYDGYNYYCGEFLEHLHDEEEECGNWNDL